MNKLLVSVSAAAALGAGGLALAAVGPAAAQEPSGAEADAEHPRGRVLQGVLETLVADGTLTQDQAVAVTEGLRAEVGDAVRDGRRHRVLAASVATAAKTIGVDVDALRDALRGGDSVADVAAAHDVDPETVVDALVASASSALDDAVAGGRLAPERAGALEARLPDLARRFVEHSLEG